MDHQSRSLNQGRCLSWLPGHLLSSKLTARDVLRLLADIDSAAMGKGALLFPWLPDPGMCRPGQLLCSDRENAYSERGGVACLLLLAASWPVAGLSLVWHPVPVAAQNSQWQLDLICLWLQ